MNYRATHRLHRPANILFKHSVDSLEDLFISSYMSIAYNKSPPTYPLLLHPRYLCALQLSGASRSSTALLRFLPRPPFGCICICIWPSTF